MSPESTENEVPMVKDADFTESRSLSGCENSKYSPIFLRKNSVFGLHNKICEKLDYNPCLLRDIFSFELLGEDKYDDRRFSVTVDHGKIFGLSDFTAHYSVDKGELKLLLKWKHLHLLFKYETDEREVEDAREYDGHIPLLYMYVHKADSSRPAVIEMTQVGDMDVEPTRPESLTYVDERALRMIKDLVRNFLNASLRPFLLSRVSEALDGDVYKSVPSLCQGLKTVKQYKTDF